MNAIITSVVVVLGSTGLALGGMLLVRKCIDHEVLRSHHEVAGYMVGIVGTLYAVLLGLIVVEVQSKYQQARMMSESEANAAADLFHLANSFPAKQSRGIQTALYDYVVVVLEKEWNSPENSTGSVVQLRKLWTILNTYEPISNREQQCYPQAVTEVIQLADSRRFRIVASVSSVPGVLWVVLVAGGVLIVMFSYFFSVASMKAQVIMTSMFVTCLSLNVLLVVLYSNPYRGDLRIQPQGFLYDAHFFKELLENAPPQTKPPEHPRPIN